ncbi:dimethyladenosine transferase-like protein [Xylaria arbuscula]|nr:dimethyladenosine transferase-like protein [Xylaria arbuscula]
MGKAKTSKRGNATGPYERPSKSKNNAAVNNVFKFTKDLGQHILKNPGIAQAIVDKAYLKPTDVVLEVGPGTGNLTVQILNQARKVIACEMDPRMAAEVTKRVQGKPEQKRLEVILGDVIKTDLSDMNFDVCISNTPYQISSPLIFKLLRLPRPPRTCVLMFQKEFALRLTARPGDPLYCRLSVNAQLYAKISHVLKVGRANFRPPPQVDSSVVRLEIKTSDRPNISFEEFDGMLRICFNRPRKILRSAFLGSKEVLKLIETNYRLWCAQNDIPIDESLVDDAAEDEDMEVDDNDNDPSNMDVDGDDLPSFFGSTKTPDEGALSNKKSSSVKKTRLAVLVKEKIRKVLEVTELAESRSAKLDENAFLRLLAAFHAEGIHFS